jgi:hypothetical protein
MPSTHVTHAPVWTVDAFAIAVFSVCSADPAPSPEHQCVNRIV